MPLCSTSSGLVTALAIAFVMLPAQYFVPDIFKNSEEPFDNEHFRTKGSIQHYDDAVGWIDLAYSQLLPSDILFIFLLVMLATFTYLFEWIQRKIIEKRILKLNQYLSASVDRLRLWDARQHQLEAKLRLVQNATAEYNLLYLLLHQRRCQQTARAARTGTTSNCFFDKELQEEFAF